ncbi:hypothetical protein [Halobaculum magnesiiphilum]|uniref:Uncharacterized protein n=1 Tax=Halobaculum magnesiiphilum TaxID=1017351 RepID=A0A8T8WHR0_9EURY|nr:hypothetical protein [Halobaculum magnesiiphilum]QZP39367.1 hypothetical protein K6T50_15775 [Halobaculum magnesiiphilum]
MDIDASEFKKNIEKALEEQSGLRMNEQNEIPFEQLFTEEFMQLYTEFDSFEALLEASQWDVEDEDDFEAIPEDEFDTYVDEHTDFPSWEVMSQTAAQRFLERQFN